MRLEDTGAFPCGEPWTREDWNVVIMAILLIVGIVAGYLIISATNNWEKAYTEKCTAVHGKVIILNSKYECIRSDLFIEIP